jgi:hypothetical protein
VSEATPGLNSEQLGAYFALMEVSSLLQYAVDEHLRADGDLSYVQFQILARLVDAPDGRLRMTDLADGVVYSRSGLTYQAGLLEDRLRPGGSTMRVGNLGDARAWSYRPARYPRVPRGLTESTAPKGLRGE